MRGSHDIRQSMLCHINRPNHNLVLCAGFENGVAVMDRIQQAKTNLRRAKIAFYISVIALFLACCALALKMGWL